jgi:hypothetical protein
MPVLRCGTAAVTFLPQVIRISVDFWADGLPTPNQGHAKATSPPQIWIVG